MSSRWWLPSWTARRACEEHAALLVTPADADPVPAVGGDALEGGGQRLGVGGQGVGDRHRVVLVVPPLDGQFVGTGSLELGPVLGQDLLHPPVVVAEDVADVGRVLQRRPRRRAPAAARTRASPSSPGRKRVRGAR